MKPVYNKRDFLIDLLLPNRCPCCDIFIPWNSLVCDGCGEKLEALTIDNDLPDKGNSLLSAYRYDGAAVEAIYASKFKGDRNFPKLCACKLADRIAFEDMHFDGIVPVPMGKKRRRLRGFNQAEVFAKYLSFFTGLPVLKNTLIRVSETEQHLLSEDERKKNALMSYEPGRNKKAAHGKHILLADDVYTTGATASACRNILLSAGAQSVTAVTEARTQTTNGA
jgi:ComF family protein